VPFQPWAKALYDYRQSCTDLYSPLVHCKPAGGPGFFNAPGFEIVEVPQQQRIFILNIAGPLSWRVMYMDGRQHPPNPRPTCLGHSIGRWEGNTLVVDTVGFNEKQWMVGTYPTTERLRLTERIFRPDVKTLNCEATIDDPGAYTAPWSLKWTINATTRSQWIPGGELFEDISSLRMGSSSQLDNDAPLDHELVAARTPRSIERSGGEIPSPHIAQRVAVPLHTQPAGYITKRRRDFLTGSSHE
jgi:hypothetical protein